MIRQFFGTAVVAAVVITHSSGAAALTGPIDTNCGTSISLTNGGQVLHHPVVTLIFWGQGWSSQTTPSMGQVVAETQDLVDGPYFSGLSQYGTIRPPRMTTIAPRYTTNDANVFIHDQDVINVITAEMAAGVVPPPNQDVDNVYVVVTPYPVQDVDRDQGTSGYHNSSSYQGVPFEWAWVGDPSGLADKDASTIGHELVETITDPTPNGVHGVWINGPCENEIGDYCRDTTETYDGFTVQGYWSAADQKCVVPESYSFIARYNGTPNNWTGIGSAARKVYAGFYRGNSAIVATDTANNVYLYSGSPPSWSVIGGPGGGMYAIGDDAIYAVSESGTQVSIYQGSGWANIGVPNGIVTAMYGGKYPVAIDIFGEVWKYSTSTSKWSLIAGYANRVGDAMGNDNSLYLVGLNYASTWRYQGSGLTLIAGNVTEVTSSGGSNDMMLFPDAFAGTWIGLQVYTPSTNAFLVTNPFSNTDSYAFGGSGLYALSPDHSTIVMANTPLSSSTSWTTIGGATPRLIGQGGTLYAVGPIAY